MKRLLYTFIASAALFACSPLDQNPSTSVTSETAITTVEDLKNAVNGGYYIATYGDMLTVASELCIYADLIGPDSYQPSSNGQNPSRMAAFSLTPADTYGAYYYLYAALASVNNAIDRGLLLEDQEGAAPYIAELYAMRGLFHFHLATYFAPIPTSGSANTMGLVLADKVHDISYIGERATLDQTYKLITDDFSKAIESGLNKEKKTGHLNYWAALGLRARAYLYWGKYTEALADCKELLKDSPYTLYTPENYTSVWSQEGTDEMLLEYLQTDTYNAQRYAPGYYTSPEGYSEYGVSEAFYNWLRADANDVRSQMVAHYTEAPAGFTGSTYNPGYYPLKYPGKSGSATPTYTNNIKVMRLAEVYLIAAEAALKVEPASAAGYLNDLRKQRITGYTDVASVTIDDILDERRKELFAEGQIAFDFWRNGKDVVNSFGTIKPTDNKTVLPLPKEELDLAKGKLVQNPGYGN